MKDYKMLEPQWEIHLKRRGVSLLALRGICLECNQCGNRWSPTNSKIRWQLPRGYWKCPDGCNEDVMKEGSNNEI